jgi:hypothetical protein
MDLHPALDINNYIQDGFVKVCDVCDDSYYGYRDWYYKNINKEVMFSEHNSWVYFIVIDNKIVKVGETGNPLGIPSKRLYEGYERQPKKSTQSRLGRYLAGAGTDYDIRCGLINEVKEGKVSIWAKKCQVIETNITIAGVEQTTLTSFHKDLEILYLKYIVSQTGSLPRCNKSHK